MCDNKLTRTSEPDGSELIFEMWVNRISISGINLLRTRIESAKTISCRMIRIHYLISNRGRATVGKVEDLEQETVIEESYKLMPRPGKEKKDHVSGQLTVRLYLSVLPETRPDEPEEDAFCYEEYANKMKSGDLILYDSIGILPTLVKLHTNSKYSNVGLIMKVVPAVNVT